MVAKRQVRFLWALTFVLVAVMAARFWMYTVDDAFIYFRYAANWLAGLGPVFNAGEPVEGYTSPLWLAELTMLGWIGLSLPLASKVLGLLYLVATILFFLLQCDLKMKVGALLVALYGEAVLWAVGGLETLAVAAHLLTAVVMFFRMKNVRQASGVGVLLGLAYLARPEAVLLFGVLPLVAVSSARTDRMVRRCILAVLGIGGTIVISHLVWRYSYYGEWLPNTFFAKAGGPEMVPLGLEYVEGWLPWVLLPVAMVVAGLAYPEVRRYAWAVLLIALPWTAHVVWAGGDHMRAHRYLVPLFPLFIWAAAKTASYLWQKTARLRPAIIVLVLIQACLQAWLGTKLNDQSEMTVVQGRFIGEWLDDNLPEDAVVAGNIAGVIPYYSRRAFIDMLGLNDMVIARTPAVELTIRQLARLSAWANRPGHLRGNAEYVLGRRPDAIIVGATNGCGGLLSHHSQPFFRADFPLLAELQPLNGLVYQPRTVEIRPSQEDLAAAARYFDPGLLDPIMFCFWERIPGQRLVMVE